MLLEKKIQLAQKQIDFHRMHFKDEQFEPNPQIDQNLLNFPDDNLSIKHIQ